MVVQPAPALAGREIHDDDPVGTLIGGVGDERGTRLAPAQVEPDVVEVGRGQRDVGREQDRLHDLVAGQVDTHQLRPAGEMQPGDTIVIYGAGPARFHRRRGMGIRT